jgi:ATP adenylyltransferase
VSHLLFTPWRYSYLTAPKGEAAACIFCEAARSPDPESTLTLWADGRIVILLNRFPYTNGHVMIAPVTHVARLYESGEEQLTAIIRASAEAQKILSDTYRPDGFNIGMNFGQAAGAGIADHYHVHVVPRWAGDSNFMSVTADTRMIPEELSATFAKLRPKFAELGSTFS